METEDIKGFIPRIVNMHTMLEELPRSFVCSYCGSKV